MLFDTVLPPLPSLPVFSLSFLFFAFIVGLELTTCYTNGVEAGLSPSILFVLIAVIVFIFPIINAWSKIIIAISTANGFYLSLAAIISGSIFLWLSYRYSVKSVNQHH